MKINWNKIYFLNIYIYIYIYIYIQYIDIYSAAGKFVNPLEFSIFLHKYDPKHNQIFAQVLKVDKENPIKQMRQKYLFIQENDPILHIYEWQKYVNLLD